MKVILQIGLISMFVLGAAGCSVSLAGMTALDEARAMQEARITADELQELERGASVRLYLVDGTSVTGEFIAIHQISSARYLELKQQGQTAKVPLLQVERMERQRRKYSIWPALAFGGAIDAAVLMIFLTTDYGTGVKLNF